VKQWELPAEGSPAFAAAMEQVLDAYAAPYEARFPLVCVDERPCALVGEAREPRPMQPGRALRQDAEYVRGGLCCLLMAFEPLRGWRRAWVRPQRRRVEFAELVAHLAEDVYPDAERIRLVCDNLNTHSAAAFYARYPPERARRLAERVEFIYTPVHGSWLNVVETEFSILVRQCLGHRRLGNLDQLDEQVQAWVAARNQRKATIHWHLTTDDARRRLRKLYPSI
jgi:hypothetical protein